MIEKNDPKAPRGFAKGQLRIVENKSRFEIPYSSRIDVHLLEIDST